LGRPPRRGRSGPAGVSSRGKATGRITWEPMRSRICPCWRRNRRWGDRLNNPPGLPETLGSGGSATARHAADAGRHGARKRITQATGYTDAGSRSVFIVPLRSSNRARRDPRACPIGIRISPGQANILSLPLREGLGGGVPGARFRRDPRSDPSPQPWGEGAHLASGARVWPAPRTACERSRAATGATALWNG